MTHIRKLLRWSLSIVLVTLPASYLFWQWQYEEHQVLGGLSYEAFNKRFSESEPGTFWTYFLYILAAVLCINIVTALLAGLLGRVFPDRAVRVPEGN